MAPGVLCVEKRTQGKGGLRAGRCFLTGRIFRLVGVGLQDDGYLPAKRKDGVDMWRGRL